jgi:hypothetical protein
MLSPEGTVEREMKNAKKVKKIMSGFFFHFTFGLSGQCYTGSISHAPLLLFKD